MTSSPPESLAISLVVEWENMVLAEQPRVRAMLGELQRQAAQLLAEFRSGAAIAVRGPLELLVMHDPEHAPASEVQEAVAACIPANSLAIRWRLVAAPAVSYYAMKNLGAEQAAGDVVVLIDSDVVPDSGWLRGLIAPLADERVQVVAGNTYVKPVSFYTRTMALAWFFPLAAAKATLEPVSRFYANNVAFRRSVLRAYPFPEHEEQSRGACAQVAQRLIEAGIQPWRNSASQVDHPPPNGLRHFLLRAASEGRDQLLHCRALRGPGKASLPRSFVRACRRWARAVGRLCRHHRQVDLALPLLPAALAVASAYYTCYLAGDLAARFSPQWTQRHIQV